MKKTFKYTKDKFLDEYRVKQSDACDFLCVIGMDKYFAIPEGTKNIWVTVSDKPMKESYKCSLSTCFKEIILTLSSELHRSEPLSSRVYCKLERLVGTGVTFYVMVEY